MTSPLTTSIQTTAVEARTDRDGLCRRERWIVIAAAILLVVYRSLVFTVWEQASFDSDQAIIGLMGLHISQLRAFPVFMYGFNYLLAVEGYLAAPVFAVLGPSVAALRVPLIAVNIAVAILLIRLLEREVKLRPAAAFAASMFFVLASPGAASELVEASGGNPEPFLYVLLLWITWNRPFLFGGLLAFGFLHREFTAYGLSALLLLDALNGALFTRARAGALMRVAISAGAVWVLVFALRPYADAAGPGAGPQWILGPASNMQTLAAHFCWAPRMIARGFAGLFTEYLGLLFGATPRRLLAFGVNSTVRQGITGLWPFLGAVLLGALGRTVWRSTAPDVRPWRSDLRFCAFLFLVGLQAAIVYVVARCGELNIGNMRYTLLTLLSAVAIVAAFLRVEPSRWLRGFVLATVGFWTLNSAVDHLRLLDDFVVRTPPNYRRVVADYLTDHGIKYAAADYWTAYHVVFLSGERVIISADGVPRILEYEWQVEKQPGKPPRVSRTPCENGTTIIENVYYLCR